MTDLEADWLQYARRLLHDEAHIRACANAGGSPAHPGVDDTQLRWPGYLGRDYRDGGVLCVANVHRDFASGGAGTAVRDGIVDSTRRWKDGDLDDAGYLNAARSAYVRGLRAWTVGGRLGNALEILDAPIEAIAYTNAAKCQFPETEPKIPKAGAIKTGLIRLCVAQNPLTDLVGLLRPAVVLVTAVNAWDASGLDGRQGAVCFHQYYGNLTRPCAVGGEILPPRTPLAEWAARLRDELDQPRSSSALP